MIEDWTGKDMTGSRHNNRGRSVPSCKGIKDASITPNTTASGTGTATTGSATTSDRGKHTVHWFRKGLRLHDNPSLREGLSGANTFRCVFVIDPWSAGSKSIGINKWRFVCDRFLQEQQQFICHHIYCHKIFFINYLQISSPVSWRSRCLAQKIELAVVCNSRPAGRCVAKNFPRMGHH